MSSIFPGGVFIAKNAVKGIHGNTAYDTITTQTDITAVSGSPYSVSGGVNIDAALQNSTWVDAIDKNFGSPTVCDFSATVVMHHAPVLEVGISLAIRVYIDEVLYTERTLACSNAVSTASSGYLTIAPSDSAIIASRIRIQFKRAGSLSTTSSSLSATISKYTPARV